MTLETDDDWTIHSLNIHGAFFERWCQDIIRKTSPWQVTATGYPVQFPLPGGSQSALDIHARHSSFTTHISLLIECKKANPEFVEWVFFPRHDRVESRYNFAMIENDRRQNTRAAWAVRLKQDSRHVNLLIADEARETRGAYSSVLKNEQKTKTKTSNAAITDAARQIALATQAIVGEERQASEYRADKASTEPPSLQNYERLVFIPTIVTSARLFSCEFNPSDIEAATGEVPIDKARLVPHQYLIYEYALPLDLQRMPEGQTRVKVLAEHRIEQYARMHILVVHSESFGPLLQQNLAPIGPFF